ncbi:MAG: biotin synthase BioB [Pseudomonadota bacterium]|nr:biotin synthase BioB [Pseudomonadota bacterium]
MSATQEHSVDASAGSAVSDDKEPRHNWTREEAEALFALPFNELIFRAQNTHRQWFDPNEVQKSTLLSIKTGGCPEDCGYCSPSAKFETGIQATKLMDVDTVLEGARRAKASGASRYCMGAAWRSPKDRDIDAIVEMIKGVREMGMETCMTLGMLTPDQAGRLKEAGLDYYNHNVDTSEEFYGEIITTRNFEDRIETIRHVQDAGINVCAGGILGMGEQIGDHASMLVTLANLNPQPQSVPINMLIPIAGTPLGEAEAVDPLDFVSCIAVARIMMPKSVVRLSAGREWMSDETQALCFLAGANSIFIGEALLTAANPELSKDEKLFQRLGLKPMPAHACPSAV